MHYAHENNEAETDKDTKLPFKTHEGCTTANSTSFVILKTTHDELLKPITPESKIFHTYTEEFLITSYFSSIWRPPKSC
ncbi:MAG: hypothetical protein HYZ54_11160 [Ignavibacteriae bacterium]|nr:hypothetical protein [Ignavibacteriota bacterium]